MTEPSSFLDELKRRKVVRAAVLYAAAAFAALEAADVIFPILDIPDWGMRLVFGLAVIGFPVVLALAWSFDLEATGLRRDGEASSFEARWIEPSTLAAAVALVLAALAAGWLLGRGGAGPTGAPDDVPQASAAGAMDPAATLSPGAALDPQALAVLPFTHRSALEEDRYFTEGIHDDILTQLHKIADLRIISRSSVQEYRGRSENLVQVGRELGVGSILEGGVQRSGDRVRINVQLIDVSSQQENHLWAETYTRAVSAANLFDVQTEIARSVARALAATLTPGEEARLAERPTESTEAYDAYLQGLAVFHDWELSPGDPGWAQAAAHFRRAVEADSTFAAAWARLGEALARSARYVEPDDRPPVAAEARRAAERAASLDPGIPAAHIVDYVLAGPGIDDDADAALEAARSAYALAPDRPELVRTVAQALEDAGRYREAAGYWRRAAASDPRSAQTAHLHGINALRRGDLALARAEIRRGMSLTSAPDAIALHVRDMAPLLHATEGYDAGLALVRRHLEVAAPRRGEELVYHDPDFLRDDTVYVRLRALDPDSVTPGFFDTMEAERALLLGDTTAARAAFGRAADRQAAETGPDPAPWYAVHRAYLEAGAGRPAAARRLLAGADPAAWLEASPTIEQRQERLVALARVRTRLGDTGAAVARLRDAAAINLVSVHPAYLETLSQWAALRDAPAFTRLVEELRGRT